MKYFLHCILTFMMLSGFASTVLAEDKIDNYPWEKFSVTAGGFLASVDTKVSLGSAGVGIGIDLEDVSGMQSTNRGFRLGVLGRFGASKKHVLDLSYYYFNRDSSRALLVTSDLGVAGDTVHSKFNMQFFKLNYNYSLLMDKRANFSAGIGLYVMPLSYSLDNVTDPTIGELETADITAPLPTLNFRLEFALTPKLFFRQGVELFYLKYGGFEGSLLNVNLGVDYKITQHFGLGLGVDSFDLKLSANGKDYPEIDFNGDMNFSYVGLMLYGKYYF